MKTAVLILFFNRRRWRLKFQSHLTIWLETSESLSEIPGSIERLDARALENARVFNFSEALRKFSGVNVRDEEASDFARTSDSRHESDTFDQSSAARRRFAALLRSYGDNASYYHPPSSATNRLKC
jgi:hypothetical protein